MRKTAIISGILLCFALAVFGVWRWSYIAALAQLESRGSARLSLASDRLVGLLERYRILPVALANDEIFVAALLSGRNSDNLSQRLQSLADMTGAQNILLADKNGEIIGSSVRLEGKPFIQGNIANRPDFRRAMNGALGIYHAQERTDSPRGFMFASAVRDVNNQIIGALVINSDLEALESYWRGDPEIVFFTDQNNVIFIANRDSLILQVLGNPDDALIKHLFNSRYSSPLLSKLQNPDPQTSFGHKVWNLRGVADIPRQTMIISQPLPVIGMTANILLDLAPAARVARIRAISAAALILFALGVWQMRRRAIARLLKTRQEANAKLEERVQQRTMQLSDANISLRRAQDDLVQAGKLAALGEMSAGISHELNQPLAAIQSYSENAAVYLERGQVLQTKANLGQIAELTGRMARIIKNLKSFARKEAETVTDVALDQVVNVTLEIANATISAQNVTVDWQAPDENIMVRGGAVRLQQVLLNLVSNAIDAMQASASKTIEIHIERDQKSVLLIVRDTGPGLKTPEKIFDPFYTTKSVEHPRGMGLGLSISYGIVQSFGGNITGLNHPDGGAEFTVRLDAAKLRKP